MDADPEWWLDIHISYISDVFVFPIAVLHTRDPSTNVVLLEDFVAVLGILVAGSCLGMTYAGVSTLADPVGSITIGLLLAGVASFIIYTNSMALVGK